MRGGKIGSGYGVNGTALTLLSAEGAKDAARQALEVQKAVQDTFLKMLDTDAGKAIVGEFMAPGIGTSLLGRMGPGAVAPAAKKEGGKDGIEVPSEKP